MTLTVLADQITIGKVDAGPHECSGEASAGWYQIRSNGRLPKPTPKNRTIRNEVPNVLENLDPGSTY
jgi:hypothetical protein